MANEKFTKGPWEICDYGKNDSSCRHPSKMEIWAGERRIVDTTCISGSDEDQDEIVGNMYLISLAPEMYSKLKDILSAYEMTGSDIHEIESILAKARGEL